MIIKFKRFLTYFLLLCAMNFRNEGDHTSPQLPIFCSINQLYPLTIYRSIYMCPSLLSCAPFSSVYAASFKFLVMCPKCSCTLRSFVVEIHSLIIQHSQKKKTLWQARRRDCLYQRPFHLFLFRFTSFCNDGHTLINVYFFVMRYIPKPLLVYI